LFIKLGRSKSNIIFNFYLLKGYVAVVFLIHISVSLSICLDFLLLIPNKTYERHSHQPYTMSHHLSLCLLHRTSTHYHKLLSFATPISGKFSLCFWEALSITSPAKAVNTRLIISLLNVSKPHVLHINSPGTSSLKDVPLHFVQFIFNLFH